MGTLGENQRNLKALKYIMSTAIVWMEVRLSVSFKDSFDVGFDKGFR